MKKGARVAEVKRRAEQGSSEDYSRLIDMVVDGVPGARQALEDLAPRKDTRAREGDDRSAFWAELRDVKNKLNDTPKAPVDLADLRRRGSQLGACEEVQAMGLEAYRLRRLGHLRAAEEHLAEASVLGGSCRFCRLDLGRRQAILLSASGDHPAALVRVDESLAGYRRVGPGHDLDGDGVAKCLSLRGKVRYFLADYSGASVDLAASLERLAPDSRVFIQGQIDLAVALVPCGAQGREEAYQLLRKPRLALRTLPMCADKAFFDWLDGQLELVRPESQNRSRGRKKIRDAVDGFVFLGMPDELLGAASDYIKSIVRNRHEATRQFLEEIGPSAKALVTDREHRRRLQVLLNESRGYSWRRLAASIHELHSCVAATRRMPCLLAPYGQVPAMIRP